MFTKIKHVIRTWLRRIEHITRTDMIYIARGGFWLSFGTIISSVFALLISVAYANLLPREVYGTYRYVLSVYAILNALSVSGMNTAVTQAVARGFEGTLLKAFYFQLRWGLLQFVAAMVVALYYIFQGNGGLGIIFLSVSILAPITNSANTWMAFLQGKKLFKVQSIYSIISAVAIYIAIFVTILFKKDVVAIAFANFAASAIINLFLIWKTVRTFHPNNKFEPDVLSYGAHLSFIGVIGIIASQCDSLILFHTLGPVQLSIYSFATIIPDRIKGFTKLLGTIALPKYAERPLESVRIGFFRKLGRFIGLLLLISVAYSVLSPFIFKFIFPKYTESIALTALYSITIVAAASSIPITFLLSKIQTKELYMFAIISGTVQIASSFVFIHFFGTTGAVYGKIFSLFSQFAIAGLLAYHVFWKKNHLKTA